MGILEKKLFVLCRDLIVHHTHTAMHGTWVRGPYHSNACFMMIIMEHTQTTQD